MPYLAKTLTGPDMLVEATSKPPFGAGFTPEQADKAVKLELWSSSFNDAGADYSEYKLFDAEGNVVGTKRIEGY